MSVWAPIDAFDVEAAYGRPLASWFDEIVAVEESEPELDKHRKLLAHLTGKPAASFVPTVTTPDRDCARPAARRHLSELLLGTRPLLCLLLLREMPMSPSSPGRRKNMANSSPGSRPNRVGRPC